MKDAMLVFEIGAQMVGYVLKRWEVDCPPILGFYFFNFFLNTVF